VDRVQWLFILAATQHVMFSLAWATAVRKARNMRAPLRGMAAFAATLASGFFLIAFREVWPDVLTRTLANVCILAAVVMLWHATCLFLQKPASDHELLLVFALGTAGIVWFGQIQTHHAWRVACLIIPFCWAIGRVMRIVSMRIDHEFNRFGAIMICTLGSLLALALVSRVAHALTTDAGLAELNAASLTTEPLIYFIAVAATLANLTFAYLVLGRLVGRLNEMTRRDPLTNLLNRRAVMDALRRRWQMYTTTQHPLTVMIIDIDHFKLINDNYGHPAGDKALVVFANVFRSAFENQRVIGRVGGEEFVALLDISDPHAAMRFAERFRKHAEKIKWPDPIPHGSVTVSIGVAVADSFDANDDSLLVRADIALYEAKHLGRNRVVVAAATKDALTRREW
jgi:diguanylate cyclase (GGDEF)-like protein